MFTVLDLHRLFLETNFNAFCVRLDEIGVKTIADKKYFINLLGLWKKFPQHLFTQKQFLDQTLPEIIRKNKKLVLGKLPHYVVFKKIYLKNIKESTDLVEALDNYFGDKKHLTIKNDQIFFEWIIQDEGDLAQLRFLQTINPVFKNQFVYYFWDN